ncbi:pseudouridine synthase [Terrilactibacillus sp. BCM23-1]|uniref:Pseudouridine synthase n=1 Tax=Terrilactibacillus tamarindi TaxID=2599694 RepID=A0A6N8CNT1_9BACI|nr:pseudouridine synthase [Terrilactibacillus tamarindi]MTT31240.1 pseudouridine synthase [Terrilactibacillus tamarindi]
MERLQKVISQSGITSRRKAENLISSGRVKVNGEVVTSQGIKVSSNDKVEVDGVQIDREISVYYLLYKPTGVISSVKDEKGRKVVTDYFPHVSERIYPVGRLDYDTSGAILLTNDGTLANLLMHPKFEIDKTYVAKIDGIPSQNQLNKLAKGIRLEDGVTAKADVEMLSKDKAKKRAIIQITIHEGRNRQVRRMFEALGFNVLKLKRERYGFLDLKGLASGDSRELKPHEVKTLYQLVNKKR